MSEINQEQISNFLEIVNSNNFEEAKQILSTTNSLEEAI